MIDVIESAAYDAKSVDLSSLGLPGDVTKLVTKHFIELRKITKKLNQAVEDKKTLEQMRNKASTESERKTLNKEILELTKALTVMRNNKIEWHARLKLEVSQLCDWRNDDFARQAEHARWREKDEKCQQSKARASKPKAIKDRRIQNVATDAPIDSSVPLQQIPPSPRPKEVTEQQVEVVVVPTSVEQEANGVDIYLANPDEVNIAPEQNAPK